MTFTAAVTFAHAARIPYEGFMPSLLALLEAPGILVALTLAASSDGRTLWAALRRTATGHTFRLLAVGLLTGLGAGLLGLRSVPTPFILAFTGVLTLFLLQMGILAGDHLRGARLVGPFLTTFAIVAPVANGALGVLVGRAAGLSVGGSALLGVLGASASYIAAPAAVRLGLPHVDPARYLTPVLGMTFPFNVTLGIPLFFGLARLVG